MEYRETSKEAHPTSWKQIEQFLADNEELVQILASHAENSVRSYSENIHNTAIDTNFTKEDYHEEHKYGRA